MNTKKEKLKKVSKLTIGDVVSLTNGDKAEFIRLKRKNFIGIIKNKTYNIPVNMFDKLIEKSNFNIDKEIKDLKAGELFYIQANNGDAVLYEFKQIKNDKIIGINPISKTKTKINKSLYAGKISA
ncbi:MAG: hypothetical protein ACOCRO_02315 [Halanaerobiales bacterium]